MASLKEVLQGLGCEAALLQRLLYLNRNQHRGAPWRGKIIQIVRLLRKTLSEARHDDYRLRRPLMRHLLAGLNQALASAHESLAKEVVRTAFMPACLTLIASIARISCLRELLEGSPLIQSRQVQHCKPDPVLLARTDDTGAARPRAGATTTADVNHRSRGRHTRVRTSRPPKEAPSQVSSTKRAVQNPHVPARSMHIKGSGGQVAAMQSSWTVDIVDSIFGSHR